MRIGQSAAVTLAVAAALLVGGGCKKAPPPDEAAVHAVIDAIEAAAEAKDAKAFLAHVSKDFKGSQEAKSYGELKRLLMFYFRSGPGWTKVVERDRKVRVTGGKAAAKVKALLARGEGAPTEAGGHVFDIRFAIEDNQWKVVAAERESVGGAGFLEGLR